MPMVSVIIPIYNASPYLRACLDSVLGQTMREIEVLCVNDGSTDGSAAILVEYAAHDARVRVISQTNAGQGAARNRGLQEARGEYVWFVDADDEIAEPDAIERGVKELGDKGLEVLFFDAATRVDSDLELKKLPVRAQDYVRQHDYSQVYSGVELWRRFLGNGEYTVSPCLMILERSFVTAHHLRFPRERIFYEDNIFMSGVMLAAQRVSHRSWRLYLRKVHSGSTVTAKPTLRHLRGYLACYLDVCKVLSRKGWNRRTRVILNDRRVIYKLHVRRLVDACPRLLDEAKANMSASEYGALRGVLVYPICEKVINGIRCLRDRGVTFTIRRILFGRQD